MDNGMMENFFGILKIEIFYDQEDEYKNIDELILSIDDYVNYYNYDGIKLKLKGLPPVNYRLQSSNYKLSNFWGLVHILLNLFLIVKIIK